VLDIGLPDANGLDVFRSLQAIRQLPVIFLTARSGEVDRIVGLELGADDYISKPFSPRELSARVRTVLRRVKQPSATPAIAAPSETPAAVTINSSNPFVVDEGRLQISYFGSVLDLTRYEYRLLKVFVERPGRVLSREQLLDMVWDDPTSSLDRTVDAHVKTLRSKLKAINAEHEAIRTHRGTGYSLKERW
jgi:two-component system catabolic regulation response regulator CreB